MEKPLARQRVRSLILAEPNWSPDVLFSRHVVPMNQPTLPWSGSAIGDLPTGVHDHEDSDLDHWGNGGSSQTESSPLAALSPNRAISVRRPSLHYLHGSLLLANSEINHTGTGDSRGIIHPGMKHISVQNMQSRVVYARALPWQHLRSSHSPPPCSPEKGRRVLLLLRLKLLDLSFAPMGWVGGL
ncbi:unnamed protein product [Pleuronectes platessa]|uniref:Uncharacterized protein n=1 Tax=Pleuronectes platessa TaxID=8262 RepID=A0A9N7W2Z4_PLEPL|nr:unnamed protein product [Pleuronectes platessa]